MDRLPYPVVEMISRHVVETIDRIQTAAGFHVDLVAERAKWPRNEPGAGKAVVYESDDAPVDDTSPIGMQDLEREYGILVWAMSSETQDEPYDTYLNTAAADVVVAILEDVSRGGYAQNTRLGTPVKIETPDEPVAILVLFTVHYRTVDGDPYRQG